MVVELDAIVDVELDDGPVVLVVDALGVDDEVVVEAVVVEGDTGGTIVSVGGTVRTGSEVGVESPEAERLVVPPAQADARRLIANATAMTPATDRRPPMRPHRSGPVNIVDTQHQGRTGSSGGHRADGSDPHAPPAPHGRRCWWRKVRDSNPR